MPTKQFWVYIMSSISRTLYIGVTNDLVRRVHQHKSKLFGGFTARYNCTRLVWCEVTTDIAAAIETEKRLKGWSRAKKIALIESANRDWADLSDTWDEAELPEPSA